MATPTRDDEIGSKPRVLVAIPFSRAMVAVYLAVVIVPVSFLIARAVWSSRPGGPGPLPLDPGRIFLLLAIVAIPAAGQKRGRSGPDSGPKTPVAGRFREAPGRLKTGTARTSLTAAAGETGKLREKWKNFSPWYQRDCGEKTAVFRIGALKDLQSCGILKIEGSGQKTWGD